MNCGPDGLILDQSVLPTRYIGDGIYNLTAANQTTGKSAATGVAAKYLVRLQNDGNITDSFRVTAPAGGAGWTIRYFDASTGGNDITAQVTATGWTCALLLRGGYCDLRVEVTPSSTVVAGATREAKVTFKSAATPGQADTVKGVTTEN